MTVKAEEQNFSWVKGMEDAGSIRPANGCSMNYTAWAYTIGLEGVES
ncbi:21893_t:CDS:2 [Rhizophagus irregularis]|nr:21893_t:CDS:2 [Rhizophagus irregularis]